MYVCKYNKENLVNYKDFHYFFKKGCHMKMKKKKKPSTVGSNHNGNQRAVTVKVIKVVVLLNRDANHLYSH